MKYRRIFTIVIDSFGIGAMDNAADYGDVRPHWKICEIK